MTTEERLKILNELVKENHLEIINNQTDEKKTIKYLIAIDLFKKEIFRLSNIERKT